MYQSLAIGTSEEFLSADYPFHRCNNLESALIAQSSFWGDATVNSITSINTNSSVAAAIANKK